MLLPALKGREAKALWWIDDGAMTLVFYTILGLHCGAGYGDGYGDRPDEEKATGKGRLPLNRPTGHSFWLTNCIM